MVVILCKLWEVKDYHYTYIVGDGIVRYYTLSRDSLYLDVCLADDYQDYNSELLLLKFDL